MSSNPVREFFRRHRATNSGEMPSQSILENDLEERAGIRWDCEMDPNDWEPRICAEEPIRLGEIPTRFVDGCHTGQAVTWLRNPTHGWPVAVFLAEVGGVAMELKGRTLVRRFFGLERVVSFVVDAFPWDEVESLAAALSNLRDFPLRLLPARRPDADDVNLFDYEVMRSQAEVRTIREMTTWESVALNADRDAPTLLDGPLASRDIMALQHRPGLLIAVIKTHNKNYLHDQGWRTLLELPAAKRTPFFKIDPPVKRKGAGVSVATWYLRLSDTDAPNAGIVRVEVPWAQFIDRWPTKELQIGFVGRLSRWLIDARCRQRSYARMPISLEPIVRAEESLKSLFTPFNLLRNRFLRHAGLIGSAQ
ncbi:MAG: hypothetical protein C0467_21675 [Planctomycetaceae bacterium]|nr:hypothetical protein [Planctomycetaceae bacterium]